MRKGVIILRPPLATPEMRGQMKRVLENDDWSCIYRTRFDGTMAVAIERSDEFPESSVEQVQDLFENHFILSKANLEVRELK